MSEFRQKIRKYERAHVTLGDYASIDVSEESDAWHLDINQTRGNEVRMAVPFKSGCGKHYLYWNDIVCIVQASESRA